MIRETLDGASTNAFMEVLDGSRPMFASRVTTGNNETEVTGTNVTLPYWVKLVRQGNLFSAYMSPDGVAWTAVGTVTINNASSAYIGLVPYSINNAMAQTATFDNASSAPCP